MISDEKVQHPQLPNQDDKTRSFLARSTIVLIILDLGAYTITKDIAVLGSGTIIATIAGLVFTYYFTRKKE